MEGSEFPLRVAEAKGALGASPRGHMGIGAPRPESLVSCRQRNLCGCLGVMCGLMEMQLQADQLQSWMCLSRGICGLETDHAASSMVFYAQALLWCTWYLCLETSIFHKQRAHFCSAGLGFRGGPRSCSLPVQSGQQCHSRSEMPRLANQSWRAFVSPCQHGERSCFLG